MKDLKKVYQTANKESAEMELGALEARWMEDYPIVSKYWRDNWENSVATSNLQRPLEPSFTPPIFGLS